MIAILLLIITFYYFQNNSNISYDPSKAEKIGISDTVQFLKKCLITEDALTKFLCSEISESEINKLESVKDINANKLCTFSLALNQTNECLIDSYGNDVEEIWMFEYEPSLGKIAKLIFRIVKLKGNYFFIKGGYSKDDVLQIKDIFILEKLDKETLEILKE